MHLPRIEDKYFHYFGMFPLMIEVIRLDEQPDMFYRSPYHAGGPEASGCCHLDDRLGSVRQIISWDSGTSTVNVEKLYTYGPFGKLLEENGTFDNAFMFTGQYYDSKIDQYYLRARQYYPHIARFTTRDPVAGDFEKPLSLHKYLYCENEPLNRIDPYGLFYLLHDEGEAHSYNWDETQQIIAAATEMVGTHPIEGPLRAFGRRGTYGIGEFDYKMYYEAYNRHLTFRLGTGEPLLDTEFGNYLAGYTLFYNYWRPGFVCGLWAGHFFGAAEWVQYRTGVSERYVRWAHDDFGSMYWQFRGAQQANREAYRGLTAQLDNIILGAAVWNLNILRYLDYFQYSEDALTW